MPDLTPVPERAIAIIPWFDLETKPSENRKIETAGLVEALGCQCVRLRADYVRNPTPSHLLSGGLLDQLASDLDAEAATLVILDTALTPVQQRNLEKRLQTKVMDRTGLILEIFGLRARTREGQLQVELARSTYERSRLVRTWTHLERQRGGRGFLAGPGETQLEADRRMLDDRVRRLKKDLEEVKRTRGLQRRGRSRSGTPVIALVGYTNAGKSTLFNRLSGADVLAKDMPFATLDPTIRRIDLPRLGEAALVDTVGFITDLPTHLIKAFQATLEEVLEADLLIHVRDRATADDREQKQDVEAVLAALESGARASLPPMIEVWNKIDCLEGEEQSIIKNSVVSSDVEAYPVSALTGEGMATLLEGIEHRLQDHQVEYIVEFSPDEGALGAWLHELGDVRDRTIDEMGSTRMNVWLNPVAVGRFDQKYPGRLLRADRLAGEDRRKA